MEFIIKNNRIVLHTEANTIIVVVKHKRDGKGKIIDTNMEMSFDFPITDSILGVVKSHPTIGVIMKEKPTAFEPTEIILIHATQEYDMEDIQGLMVKLVEEFNL